MIGNETAAEKETIRTIRESVEVKEYELLLIDLTRATWESSCTDRAIALRGRAEGMCKALLLALHAQGIPVGSDCGVDGSFAIYFRGDGFTTTLAGWWVPPSKPSAHQNSKHKGE